MKAKNLSQLIKVFNPNLHLDETQHQFFVNIFGKELDRLVTEIIHAPNNQIFLITGQSGNGKTSMLRNLQKEYPNELKDFYFLYLDGRDLIKIEDLKIEDVMYKIAKKLEPSENISKNIDIDTLNEIINRYENKVLKGKKRPILIIDDFEKIVITDLNKTEDAYYKFLFEGIPSLRYLNCIKLITFPFHHKNRALVEDAVFKDFIVHLDDNGSLDIDKIQQVILKRLEDTTLISDIPCIIKNSGANMRQLIQLVHQAGIEAQTAKGAKIDEFDIKRAISIEGKKFKELIEKDLEFYQYVHKHKNIDFQNEQHRALLTSALRNRTVFAYLFNDNYYYALNPVVIKFLESKVNFFLYEKNLMYYSVNKSLHKVKFMIKKALSPTDQLKLQKLISFIETKRDSIYIIGVNTQNLYKLFVEFLEDKIDRNSFLLYKLYNEKSIEKTVDELQFKRDALLADSKIHIFIVDSKGWNAFLNKGDLFFTASFKEQFYDNTPVKDIETKHLDFNTEKLYQLDEEYKQNSYLWSNKEKRDMANDIAINAYKLREYELSLKYFLILVPLVKELDDIVLEATCYFFIGDNYQYLNEYNKALEYYLKALKIFEQENLQEDMAEIYKEIGYIYKKLNQTNKAKQYYLLAIEINKDIKDYNALAESYLYLGILYSEIEQYKESVKYYKKAKEIYEKNNNKKGMADTLNNIGLAYYLNGYFVESLKYFNKALQLYDNKINIGEIANVVNNIAMAYYDMADWDKALKNYKKALTIYEKLYVQENIAKSYGNIGLVYLKQHKNKKAIEFFYKCINIYEKLNDITNLNMAYNNLALAYMENREYEKAIDIFEFLLDYAKKTNNAHKEISVYINLGGIYLKKQEPKTALKFLTKALNLAKEGQDNLLLARSYHSLAQAYFMLNELDKAIYHIDEAIYINETLENIESMAFEYKIKGQIYTKQEKYEEALKAFNNSIKMIETINDKSELFGIYYETGTAYQRLNRYEESIELFEKALTQAKKQNEKIEIIDTLISLGISYFHIGEQINAAQYLTQAYEIAKEIGYEKAVRLIEEEFIEDE